PAFDNERRRWRHLHDATKQRRWCRHVAERKEKGQSVLIDFRRESRCDQCLDLGAEAELTRSPCIKERLLAGAISREKKPSSWIVPDTQRKHPIKARNDAFAPCPVSLDDDFSVGTGPKGVAARLELAAELMVIVDLAIERDDDLPIVASHGLRPGFRQIQNREAAMTEKPAVTPYHAAPVRTAVSDGPKRGIDVDVRPVTEEYGAEYSTHVASLVS
ncbi:MAG TPA: hypothetical protein VK540_22765, partial [Polyangiaceae bacterium]|nr:hypothetical protein [Polyangiaceae bacterium]